MHKIYLGSKCDITIKFSVKLNGETEKGGRQMDKGTTIGAEAHHAFTEITRRYEMVYKYGRIQKQKTCINTKTHNNKMIYWKYTYGNVHMIYI